MENIIYIKFQKIILFGFLLFSICSFSRAGFSETFFSTPGGHTICNCDPYSNNQTPILIGFERLEKLDKWYFYKNNIVGKGTGYFFIFDESSEEIQYFKDEKLWKKVIDEQNIEPIFFTRWISLRDSPDDFLFGIVILVIISSPILIGLIIVLWILTYKKIIIWTKRKLNIIGAMIVILLLYTFSNYWLTSF